MYSKINFVLIFNLHFVLRLVLVSLRFITVLILIFWILLFFLSFNEYKDNLENFFKENYNINFKIEKDITAGLFPLPHLEIKDVVITNHKNKNIYEGDIKIYISYNILLKKEISSCIYQVAAINSKIDLEHFIDYFKINRHKHKHLINVLPNIKLINITLSFGTEFIDCLHIKELDLVFKNSILNKSYKLISDLNFNNINYNFSAELSGIDTDGKVSNANIKISNPMFELEISGNGERFYDIPEFHGKTKLNIHNLKDFVIELEKAQKDKNNQVIKDNMPIFQSRQININSKTILKNSALRFFDIKISGNGITDFEGLIDMSLLNNKIEWYYNFNASRLDLDYFLQSNKFSNLKEAVHLLDYHSSNSVSMLNRFITAYIEINIDKINLLGEEISDFVFNADIMNGELYINNASCLLPGNGKINLVGYYSRNSFRPKFDGDLSIVITDLSSTIKWLGKIEDAKIDAKKLFLKANLIIIPHRIRLDNIKAAFDSTLMMGRINLIQDANNQQLIESAVKFNELDFDKFNFNNKFDNLIKILVQSDQDKSGNTYFKNVNDHKWLRYLDYSLNIDFMAQKSTFKGKVLKDFFASLEISPGMFSINNLSFEADDHTKLDSADFTLSLDNFKPTIKTTINFATISLDFIQKIFPMEMLNTQKNNKINTFSLYNFDGLIKFQASKIIIDGVNTLKDLITSFQLENGMINLINSKCNFFNGEIAAVGNITAVEYVPQINLKFVLNNINPGLVLHTFAKFDKLDGYMSASGSINSSGDTWSAMVKRVTGKVNLIGKNIKWKGFDLDEIIKTLDLTLNTMDKISRVNYYTNYGSSFFNNLNGNINITGTLFSIDNLSLSNNRVSGAMAARYDVATKMLNSIAKYSFIPIGITSPISFEAKGIGQMPNIQSSINIEQLIEFIKSSNTMNPSVTVNTSNAYNELRRSSGY